MREKIFGEERAPANAGVGIVDVVAHPGAWRDEDRRRKRPVSPPAVEQRLALDQALAAAAAAHQHEAERQRSRLVSAVWADDGVRNGLRHVRRSQIMKLDVRYHGAPDNPSHRAGAPDWS